jgi:hypothetical protein
LIRAGRADTGAGTLCPDRCGKGERGDDRNAAQEMLHDFDPPLQFWIGRGMSDADCTLKRATCVNGARTVLFQQHDNMGVSGSFQALR